MSNPQNCKSFGCDKPQKEKEQETQPECKSETEPKRGIRGFLQSIERPWLVRNFGTMEKEMVRSLLPSLGLYSFATLVAVIYLCDWRPVVRYIPYYSGKFSDENSAKKKKKKKKKKKEEAEKPPENSEGEKKN